MDTNKKKFRLTQEQKNILWSFAALSTWTTVGFLLGRINGYNLCNKQINDGLAACFKSDPTLKQHMVDTALKVQGEMLMGNKGL